MARVRIGTSGWVYRHWRGDFYPEGLKARDEFGWYARCFDTAEINASFYRMPTEAAVSGWCAKAPDGFVYAWKASRYITHMKRLTAAQESLSLLVGRAEGLGQKLGPVLFQLPPSMKLDVDRLASFLTDLPRGLRCAFEFRHPSWYAPETFEALAGRDCALAISDHHHAPAPWVRTGSWVYVRGHGPTGGYFGDYGEARLKDWAARLGAWSATGADAYVYFDNDIGRAAPRDALLLKRLLGT